MLSYLHTSKREMGFNKRQRDYRHNNAVSCSSLPSSRCFTSTTFQRVLSTPPTRLYCQINRSPDCLSKGRKHTTQFHQGSPCVPQQLQPLGHAREVRSSFCHSPRTGFLGANSRAHNTQRRTSLCLPPDVTGVRRFQAVFI